MTLPIYTYDDSLAIVNTDDRRKIDHLLVLILSGDEIVRVYYEDGTYEEYDADKETGNYTRIADYYEGLYEVKRDELIHWKTIDEGSDMGAYGRISDVRRKIFG